MTKVVTGRNCAQAWARGVIAIQNNGAPISPLVTEITDPGFFDASWMASLSPRAIDPAANTLRSVIEMIAPNELRLARPAAYARSWRKFDLCRGAKLRLSNWGDTYFERLTRTESGVNRLDEIIEKMKAWNGRRVAAFYAHTTYSTIDAIVPIGSPCLQYVQFVQRPENKLDLFAVYRNHDFFLKALGNYIGLGRLLAFVSRETAQVPGLLTCFSINAYLDNQRKVCALAQPLA